MIHKVILYLFMAYEAKSDRQLIAKSDSILIHSTVNHINGDYKKHGFKNDLIDVKYLNYVYGQSITSHNKNKYFSDFENIVKQYKGDKETLSIFYYFGHGETATDSSKRLYKYIIDKNKPIESDNFITGNELYTNALKINNYSPTLIMINTCFRNSTNEIGE